MKRNNRTKEAYRAGISIKWKLIVYMLGFSVIILILLWLCQIVFLPQMYKMIKVSEIKSVTSELAANVDLPDISSRAEKIAEDGGFCVMILYLDDRNAVSVHEQQNCALHDTGIKTVSLISQLYNNASKEGGEALFRFNRDAYSAFLQQIGSGGDVRDFFRGEKNTGTGRDESILYTLVKTTATGSDAVIIVNSLISPVDATVNTLRMLFFFIAGMLILLAVVLSLIISRRISKPIIEINRSAKILATGDYETQFKGKGYREVAELSATLNYAASELSKVDGLRRELIANISHDLRTPLTMISGYSEVMRDIPGENTPENLQIIIDETNRLTSLVNDVLDISKLQSGTQKLEMESLDITAAVEEAMDRYAKLRERDGYCIRFDFDRHADVKADRTRIMQVIYNLVNNAVTYTGDDKTVVVAQTCQNGKVRISVTDTGEGIEPDKLDLIWDRYYKVDKVHKRAAMGTGLGLSIVKSIMELHGGLCGVESTPGVGSTFYIELDELPAQPAENDE